MKYKFLGYQCTLCKAEYQPEEDIYVCPRDGGNLDIIYDYSAFQPDLVLNSQEESLWRYLPLLPVNEVPDSATPIKSVGWTPIYSPEKLRNELGLSTLWVKDESRNPS